MYHLHFKNTNDKIKIIEPTLDLGCFNINNTIVIDYPIIRKCLKNDTEKDLIQHIRNIFSKTENNIDIHLNMKKFTSTDMVTYIHLINKLVQLFSNEYPDKLNICYVYHSSPLLSIYKLFNDKKLMFIN